MFQTLLVLYFLFNIISIIIVLICCACAMIGNSKLNKVVGAKVALPTFSECKSTFRMCNFAGILFLLMDWLLFANGYDAPQGNIGVTGIDILAGNSMIISYVWIVMLVVVIISEIVTAFSKNKYYHMKEAIFPIIFITFLTVLLTFIIA